MRKGQKTKLPTLPISVPLTVDMLNLAEVAKAAGVNVFTFHRWRRHERIEIVITDCTVSIVPNVPK